MSTSSTSAATSTFTGSSSFSSSLAQVITRAVAFRQLPITALQNQQSALTSQQTEVQALGADFSSLQTALNGISTATGSGAYSAGSSSATVATASLSSGVQAGTYSINVTSIGAKTNTVSSTGLTTVADPSATDISSSAAFTLTAGGTFQISNPSLTLNGLAAAINASGAPVQATVVNVGGSSAPDYRLSLQGTQYSNAPIQLNDGSQNLLTTLALGSSVAYQINGLPASPVTSTSRSLAISPGVTVNVLGVGSSDITVSQNGSSIGSALSAFATSYNTAADEVAKNRGQNGGALAGQSVLLQLSSTLRSLSSYSGTAAGGVNSLADLGLTFDENGHLQFDSSAFASATSSSLTGALNFLGSATSGGFLQSAGNALDTVTDSTTGIITRQTQSLAASINTLTTTIGSDQAALTTFQNQLSNQMAQADALIASLEQQTSQITDLFAAQQTLSRSITG